MPEPSTPPAQPVDWICVCREPELTRVPVRVTAQFWATARAEGAARLGVRVDQVQCVRASVQTEAAV